MNEPFLQASVGVDYPSLSVDVEVTANAGESLGLVGRNGAGKTTVLRAIAGLRALDRGSISLNGTTVDDPLNDTFVEPQRRKVGVVFQDYRLFPHMSALDNVAFGLRCASHDRKAARAKAAEWLSRLDLADHADNRPATLSGGQAQRVALARALAIEPDVLLLDEPLAAIDPEARQRIRDDLARYLAGFNGVTVVVSHQHDDIRVLADRAIVVEHGRVSWSGPSSALS
jgi:molybdate transport system ATP-binding protein